MKLRFTILLLVALAMVLPAAAQEQRGSITGIVRDSQGGALVGASVVAKSAAGASVEVVTDGTGNYRFVALNPGQYEVTAALSGFAPHKVANIELLLGQVLTVNLTLKPGGQTETVQVVGESPLIDVKQSARATDLRDEAIEKMPKGRDFTSLVTQAPGANYETKSGGYSLDGSSAAENRFIIDGAETTDIRYGTSGKDLITDFVEEVQIKSSGYAAEYGGSTGGVINVLTKSGSNVFRGDVTAYLSSAGLGMDCGGEGAYCDGRQSLRQNPNDNSVAEYVTYPKDAWTRWDPGFDLSGPIVKDKLWFFAGYQPRLSTEKRTWTALSDNLTRTDEQKISQQFLTLNVTGQPSAKTRFKLAYNNSHYRREGLLPTLDGTTDPLANLAVTRISPNWSTSGSLDYTPTNKIYMSLKAAYFTYDDKDEGVYDKDRYVFANTNIGLPGVPADLQRPSGTQNQTSIFSNTKDLYRRAQVQYDTTFFFSGAGEHQLKAGVLFDYRYNDALYGETANRITFQWNKTVGGERGTYGYYQVRSNSAIPERGYLEVGKVSTNSWQLFIQDSWTIAKNFTLNYGLRTENEVSPSYADPSYGFASDAIKFGFGDKLAPRVGFAWDIKGDGRWKAYGSWGMFYDILKMDLARGSFGGAKWLEYYYSLDTPDWPSLVDVPGCPPACPGTLLLRRDYRYPSNDAVQAGIKPMRLQEAVVGADHELAPTLSVGLRYVHKQVDRAVEDIGNLDAAGNETYVIGNPGFGENAVYVTPDGRSINLPKAKRDYDAVELSLTRRMANHWSAHASYLWSRLYGNYAGLSESDENGRVSPDTGRNFDYPIMSFDQNAQPVFGVLATDHTHQIKLDAVYDAPFGVSVGGHWFLASGIPITREAAFIAGSDYPVFYLGRDSDGRTPFFNQLDLFAQYMLKLGGRRALTFNANLINVFGTNTVTNKYPTQLQSGQSIDITEDQFFQGVNTPALIQEQGLQQDPRFLQAIGFQAPRQLRLGVKFSF
ncbi:MAG TPA: TonB-dependent receptor [Vicinamibacteria bacterium]|nr:TonB-dependent receptor [Vicinamibacteria bacterium]